MHSYYCDSGKTLAAWHNSEHTKFPRTMEAWKSRETGLCFLSHAHGLSFQTVTFWVCTEQQIALQEREAATTWLPNGYSQIFRSYVFAPSGLKDYGSATLSCKIWTLPFLGLCQSEGHGEQFKERNGSNFAAQRSGAIVLQALRAKRLQSKN